MQRSTPPAGRIAFAVLGLTGLATLAPAQAQNVTVFGIADAALRRVDNQGLPTVNSMVSGSNSTSRLGFRGQEDLGGGLWAGYHLEHGIVLDHQPGQQDLGRAACRPRLRAQLQQLGPLRPLQLRRRGQRQQLHQRHASGPDPQRLRQRDQHDLRGLRLGWSDKTLELSGAVTVSRNALTDAAGSDFKDVALAGRVSLGPTRVSLGARRFRHAQSRQTNWLLGLWWHLGLGELRLSYNQADLSGRVGSTAVDANDARQLGVGYVHALSKRSVVYATLSRLDNRGGATWFVPGGASGLVAGGHSTGLEFGLRHSF
jgi:predicted porin